MFSDVTSVIMATMVEVAQRMLTNLPTVPRTSERGIWPSASSPTRARAPRTEITRPNDVTGILPGTSNGGFEGHYAQARLDKLLSRGEPRPLKSEAIRYS